MANETQYFNWFKPDLADKALNWGEKALADAILPTVSSAVQGYRNLKPEISSLMNLHPLANIPSMAKKYAYDPVKSQFDLWSGNEQDLYNTYMSSGGFRDAKKDEDFWDVPYIKNPRQYSSAFGEAKGANLANAPFLGPTIFKDTPLDKLDYGIGLAQLLAGNTVNSAYQLMQEGGKSVKDQGWKGLLSTDWLQNAYDDVVEEGRGFSEARMADNTPTTEDDLWRIADTIDDANISKPLGQTVDELRPTTDTIIREAQDNISKRQAAEAARQAKIIADQTRMQQGQVSRPTVLPKPVKATPLSGPAGYTKPAASSVSTVPRRRARATRGRTAPVIRQPSRQARNYFGGYQR